MGSHAISGFELVFYFEGMIVFGRQTQPFSKRQEHVLFLKGIATWPCLPCLFAQIALSNFQPRQKRKIHIDGQGFPLQNGIEKK